MGSDVGPGLPDSWKKLPITAGAAGDLVSLGLCGFGHAHYSPTPCYPISMGTSFSENQLGLPYWGGLVLWPKGAHLDEGSREALRVTLW